MIKAKIKKCLKIPAEARAVILQCAIFFLAMILTPVKLMFGLYPFGLALVASCKRYTPFAFVGSVFSVIFFMESSPAYIVALVGILSIRIVASFFKKSDLRQTLGEKTGGKIAKLMFCEGTELKVSVGALAALGIGIYSVIANGYLYYDIFVLIFGTVLVGIITYAFSVSFDMKMKKRSFIFAISSLGFAMSYALSGKEIQGIDLSIIIAYSLTLYLSKHISGTGAGAIGLIMGLSQGVLAPVFAIGGIVSGFLWGVSPYLSVMSAFIISMGYGIFIAGYEAIVLLASELLLSTLVMYPLLRFDLIPKPSFLAENEVKSIQEYHLEARGEEIRKRLDTLCVSYKDIAKMFRALADKTKNPQRSAYSDMALEICEGYCYSCPKESICWERDTATTKENIDKMGNAVYVNSQVSKTDVDEKFLHRCPNIEKIIEELNRKRSEQITEGVRNDKLEISACDYELTAKIIEALNGEYASERIVDARLTERVSRACVGCGLVFDKAEVTEHGGKEIIITGIDIQKSRCTEKELIKAIEDGAGVCLDAPMMENGDAFAMIKVRVKAPFTVKSYKSTSVIEGGEINGDTVTTFEGCDNKQYMLICDGMGSGKEAGLTSGASCDFLEKILCVTSEKRLALSMLNSIIRAKGTECSTTVDLLEIDLVSAEGRFLKSGASPSFIKRGDKVFKLQSKTAPIGIMKRLDAELLSFNLAKGDICVMVSDGVVSGKSDQGWLIDMLKEADAEKIEMLPEQIIKSAKEKNRIKDDMSVLAVIVE